MSQKSETVVYYVLQFIALSAMGSLLLIALFILKEGFPFILEEGPSKFLFSSTWEPAKEHFGIFPMLVGSVWVTFGALVVGGPLGVAGAIYLVEFTPKGLMRIIKPVIELLAGIPSVVYGFMGVAVLAPLIRTYIGGPGLSVLAASLILGIMILPTVMSISMDALNSVPPSYKEGSLALGATRWQTQYMVVLKAAKSGILASIILGMGRAIGETMAVIMVAGNAVKIPNSVLDSVRTLTANIALEMGYATGRHRQALFATGVVLFLVIMMLNSFAMWSLKERRKK
ncbi:MAG TPA: phosphate ABC transporter permease subunit PstC [Candidatus Hydrogenedentes bacterium]|nr:phosphate ABC transporter permease subunit PstC [Candidatus Hydrogenedentota bacterium]HOL76078.1 phosphate ABC transporter permease subunit PstC [Candidatus Hydrogenedentota bacterium]HPO84692.1 phosphate ABC transporter permease subunit PstC [Candidatus Hydrogenedentota bacterium]